MNTNISGILVSASRHGESMIASLCGNDTCFAFRTFKESHLMCINVDLTEFELVRRTLETFLGIDKGSIPDPRFTNDWHERINRFVAAWTAERSTTLGRLDRSGRRALIGALQARGGFEGRRAPAYVAQILGVSRATIYNELARLRLSALAA